VLNIRNNLRDDERRRRDEARLGALEEQIDELRLLLREGGSRQAQGEESQGTLGELVAGLGERIEAARHEARVANEARIVELTRLRSAAAETDAQYTSALAPLPGLQAQLTEMGNQIRTKFQELGDERHRFGELQAQIERLPPQVERGAEIARGVRDELGGLRVEIDTLRADWRKVNDAIGMVEQDVRRRTGDLGVELTETNGRIDALKEQLPPLDIQIARVRSDLQLIVPRFEQLAATDSELREESDRHALLAIERHTQAMARADEARAGVEERLRLFERLNDTRFSATMTRFTGLEEADRAIGHRLTLLAVRLDELRDRDAELRGEMHRLEELRLRVRIEQAQQEAQLFATRLAELQARADGDGDGDGDE